jgi:hypothetical protein
MKIEFDQRQLAEVNAMLADINNGAARAMTRAINRTLDGVRSQVVKRVAKEINLTQKVIREHTATLRATPDKLTGLVRVTGQPIPLIDYGARKTQRGVTVRVRKQGERELFPESFIAAMPNKRGGGHTGVFRRAWTGAGRVGRLPIEERYGPGVAMVFHYNAEDDVTEEGADRLARELEHEADYLLRQATGRL